MEQVENHMVVDAYWEDEDKWERLAAREEWERDQADAMRDEI